MLPDVLVIKRSKTNTELKKHDKGVVIDCNCGSAVLRGSNIYAPGVLSMETSTKTNEIVSVYIDMTKKCKRGLRIPFDCPEKLFIGNGQVKMTRYDLFREDPQLK